METPGQVAEQRHAERTAALRKRYARDAQTVSAHLQQQEEVWSQASGALATARARRQSHDEAEAEAEAAVAEVEAEAEAVARETAAEAARLRVPPPTVEAGLASVARVLAQIPMGPDPADGAAVAAALRELRGLSMAGLRQRAVSQT
jgi:hypothetical protein